jgi:molecular chaperone DnaJ
MIRMPAKGEATPGGVAGDLYVKLHVRADREFSRDGSNILTTLQLKITDAILGGEREIKTLEGVEKLSIPAGISHGEVIRLRGKGVPTGKGARGDLLVEVRVQFPKSVSKTSRELLEKLRNEGL